MYHGLDGTATEAFLFLFKHAENKKRHTDEWALSVRKQSRRLQYDKEYQGNHPGSPEHRASACAYMSFPIPRFEGQALLSLPQHALAQPRKVVSLAR